MHFLNIYSVVFSFSEGEYSIGMSTLKILDLTSFWKEFGSEMVEVEVSGKKENDL